MGALQMTGQRNTKFQKSTSITNAIRLKATSSIEMNLAWEQNDV